VKATDLLIQEALLSLRAAAVHRALVLLARRVQANHLPEPLSPQEERVQVYLVGQAKPAAWLRLQPDSRQQPVTGLRLGARPRELAAARSWDFQF
jgi:hypothetical protein